MVINKVYLEKILKIKILKRSKRIQVMQWKTKIFILFYFILSKKILKGEYNFIIFLVHYRLNEFFFKKIK